ncbi:hypothetical protein IQ07DRAFT_14079 [Pyrenochaeta sp. DS3sAY3a]|nr:hypothetical protein IQ07DRAFT_14079 [Pyrenochaeta sp. DS3sAY3a]
MADGRPLVQQAASSQQQQQAGRPAPAREPLELSAGGQVGRVSNRDQIRADATEICPPLPSLQLGLAPTRARPQALPSKALMASARERRLPLSTGRLLCLPQMVNVCLTSTPQWFRTAAKPGRRRNKHYSRLRLNTGTGDDVHHAILSLQA